MTRLDLRQTHKFRWRMMINNFSGSDKPGCGTHRDAIFDGEILKRKAFDLSAGNSKLGEAEPAKTQLSNTGPISSTSKSSRAVLWRSKVAAVAGIGVPLAILVAGEPAAAEPTDYTPRPPQQTISSTDFNLPPADWSAGGVAGLTGPAHRTSEGSLGPPPDVRPSGDPIGVGGGAGQAYNPGFDFRSSRTIAAGGPEVQNPPSLGDSGPASNDDTHGGGSDGSGGGSNGGGGGGEEPPEHPAPIDLTITDGVIEAKAGGGQDLTARVFQYPQGGSIAQSERATVNDGVIQRSLAGNISEISVTDDIKNPAVVNAGVETARVNSVEVHTVVSDDDTISSRLRVGNSGDHFEQTDTNTKALQVEVASTERQRFGFVRRIANYYAGVEGVRQTRSYELNKLTGGQEIIEVMHADPDSGAITLSVESTAKPPLRASKTRQDVLAFDGEWLTHTATGDRQENWTIDLFEPAGKMSDEAAQVPRLGPVNTTTTRRKVEGKFMASQVVHQGALVPIRPEVVWEMTFHEKGASGEALVEVKEVADGVTVDDWTLTADSGNYGEPHSGTAEIDSAATRHRNHAVHNKANLDLLAVGRNRVNLVLEESGVVPQGFGSKVELTAARRSTGERSWGLSEIKLQTARKMAYAGGLLTLNETASAGGGPAEAQGPNLKQIDRSLEVRAAKPAGRQPKSTRKVSPIYGNRTVISAVDGETDVDSQVTRTTLDGELELTNRFASTVDLDGASFFQSRPYRPPAEAYVDNNGEIFFSSGAVGAGGPIVLTNVEAEETLSVDASTRLGEGAVEFSQERGWPAQTTDIDVGPNFTLRSEDLYEKTYRAEEYKGLSGEAWYEAVGDVVSYGTLVDGAVTALGAAARIDDRGNLFSSIYAGENGDSVQVAGGTANFTTQTNGGPSLGKVTAERNAGPGKTEIVVGIPKMAGGRSDTIKAFAASDIELNFSTGNEGTSGEEADYEFDGTRFVERVTWNRVERIEAVGNSTTLERTISQDPLIVRSATFRRKGTLGLEDLLQLRGELAGGRPELSQRDAETIKRVLDETFQVDLQYADGENILGKYVIEVGPDETLIWYREPGVGSGALISRSGAATIAATNAKISDRFNSFVLASASRGWGQISRTLSLTGEPDHDDATLEGGYDIETVASYSPLKRALSTKAYDNGEPIGQVSIVKDADGTTFANRAFPANQGPVSLTTQAQEGVSFVYYDPEAQKKRTSILVHADGRRSPRLPMGARHK